ncbi:RASSF7_8 [Lepeophtheirus salmonis]|uniref:RASSF7_8 n=1 Tax=Lepeophtheirus salmonis TaxID=72036 RepID=A0A7R8CVD6_LEPSM|nr:RASSF7_8 [Lepeophtheirus salmonis]CAF2908076.1 RASSF7_8 [Lepeophtheirus salmonis]
MELKVWVEGIQRIVCGVTEKTTCQDVVYALAHATGKTGRFTLIERWRNSERLLAPQEHPLKVLQKRGEYMSEVQFILKRSALDNSTKPPASSAPSNSSSHPLSPRLHRARYSSSAGLANHSKSLPPFEAIRDEVLIKREVTLPMVILIKKWGGGVSGYRRYALGHPSQQPLPDYGFTNPKTYPPAYRPPPPPHPRNASPSDPPPYRAPPPPGVRFRPPKPTSPTAVVRPPHYSPPPVHRTPHLSRHPSKSSLVGIDKGDRSSKSLMGKNNPPSCSSISNNYCNSASNIQYSRRAIRPSHLEIQDLYNLISAQQSAIHSQQTELKKYDSEVGYLEGHGYSSSSTMLPDPLTPSLDVVVSEVRRLEEVSQRNENELCHLGLDAGGNASNTNSAGGAPSLFKEDAAIRDEISQLKQRLAGTDQELQKTNATLK